MNDKLSKKNEPIKIDRVYVDTVTKLKDEKEISNLLIKIAEKDKKIFSLEAEIARLNAVIINFKIDKIRSESIETEKKLNLTLKEISDKYDIELSTGSIDTETLEFIVDEDKLETHDSHGKILKK